MKKFLLIACTLFVFNHTYIKSELKNNVLIAGETLAELNTRVENLKLNQTDNDFLFIWQQTISSIIDYCIKNSSNFIGQKDNIMIASANQMRNLNNRIIYIYAHLIDQKINLHKDNQLREKFETILNHMKQLVAQEQYKVSNSHHTTKSKQDTQKILFETARRLLMILEVIKKKLNNISIYIS